ncbi:uncharacterized protein LOC118182600 isoform X2 [Stegodyphus dumicola]|uniref:uncharacterized protein LOC118182600 isoform X2 n=1 Tax=Stegodyphus dumicola TaxID=202533 RepID=UPI0015AC2A0D|nr:uncharacterized protein LOC118182600 isoform X2 [Stegodyphus dumicola]
MTRVCPRSCSLLASAVLYISTGIIQLGAGVILLRSNYAPLLVGPDVWTALSNIVIGSVIGVLAAVWKESCKRNSTKHRARQNVLAALATTVMIVNATCTIILLLGGGNKLLTIHLESYEEEVNFENRVLAYAYMISVCSPTVCTVVGIVTLSSRCFRRAGEKTLKIAKTGENDRRNSSYNSWVYDSEAPNSSKFKRKFPNLSSCSSSSSDSMFRNRMNSSGIQAGQSPVPSVGSARGFIRAHRRSASCDSAPSRHRAALYRKSIDNCLSRHSTSEEIRIPVQTYNIKENSPSTSFANDNNRKLCNRGGLKFGERSLLRSEDEFSEILKNAVIPKTREVLDISSFRSHEILQIHVGGKTYLVIQPKTDVNAIYSEPSTSSGKRLSFQDEKQSASQDSRQPKETMYSVAQMYLSPESSPESKSAFTNVNHDSENSTCTDKRKLEGLHVMGQIETRVPVSRSTTVNSPFLNKNECVLESSENLYMPSYSECSRNRTIPSPEKETHPKVHFKTENNQQTSQLYSKIMPNEAILLNKDSKVTQPKESYEISNELLGDSLSKGDFSYTRQSSFNQSALFDKDSEMEIPRCFSWPGETIASLHKSCLNKSSKLIPVPCPVVPEIRTDTVDTSVRKTSNVNSVSVDIMHNDSREQKLSSFRADTKGKARKPFTEECPKGKESMSSIPEMPCEEAEEANTLSSPQTSGYISQVEEKSLCSTAGEFNSSFIPLGSSPIPKPSLISKVGKSKKKANSLSKSKLRSFRVSAEPETVKEFYEQIFDGDSLIGLSKEELIARTLRIRALRKEVEDRPKE